MKDIKFENVTTEQAAKLSELYAALKGDGIGELSDGYHTFNELYHHRAILFSVICNTYPEQLRNGTVIHQTKQSAESHL